MNKERDIAAIDALLPQTQCGLCTYKGCKPYAEAIVLKNERIDLCLPGGVEILQKIGALQKIDPTPFENDMRAKAKPPMLAIIREADCIGCTKCIQACPVDAIVGAAKLMHVVITDVCNGCELCVPPCPVDCIDMVVLSEKNTAEKEALAKQSFERFQKHNARIEAAKETAEEEAFIPKSAESRKAEIAAILARRN